MFTVTIFSLTIFAVYTAANNELSTLKITQDTENGHTQRTVCVGQTVEIEYDYQHAISTTFASQRALRSNYTIMHNGNELYRANFNNKPKVKLHFSTQNFTAGDHVFACKVPFESPYSSRNNTLVSTLSLFKCTFGQRRRYKKLQNARLQLYCPDTPFGEKVYWSLDGQELKDNTEDHIRIHSLQHQDIGKYQCYSTNRNDWTATIYTFDVQVLYTPEKVQNIQVLNTTDTTAALIWDRDRRTTNKVGVQVSASWRVFYDIRYAPVFTQGEQKWTNLQTEMNSVTLSGLDPQVVYLVQVRARTEIKNLTSDWEKKLILRQRYRSDWTAVNVALAAKYGQSVRMMCVANLTNAPGATVTWSREIDGESKDMPPASIADGSYILHVVTEEDAGLWKCSINARQNISSSMLVIVYSQKLYLTIQKPPPGQQTTATPIDVQCTDETADSIKVVWKGDPTKARAANYRIRYKSHEENSQKPKNKPTQVDVPATGGTENVVLNGLQSNMKYSIKVAAVGENGFEGGSVKKFCVSGANYEEW